MQQAPLYTPEQKGDLELVHRIRRGDEQAVSEMYHKYARYIAAIAYRLMGNDADLDDIVQDTFVSAVKSMGRLKDATVLKTWLATIAVRSTSRYAETRRRQRRIVEETLTETSQMGQPVHGVSLEVRELLAQVPYKYRAPWILFKVMEMNLEEASHVCNCSVATSKRRIAKADKLIGRLRDEH